MFLPRRFAFTLCAVSGLIAGSATLAQAAPAAVAGAPAIEAGVAQHAALPGVEKTYYYYHHWHHWHHWHHYHRWHHWHHWHHW